MQDATVADFDQQVQGPMVVVDFWAPWCGPCKMMAPAMEKLAQNYAGKIKFVRFNVDDDKSIPARYKVMSMPSLVLFCNGVAKERVTGFYPYERLAHYFDRKLVQYGTAK